MELVALVFPHFPNEMRFGLTPIDASADVIRRLTRSATSSVQRVVAHTADSVRRSTAKNCEVLVDLVYEFAALLSLLEKFDPTDSGSTADAVAVAANAVVRRVVAAIDAIIAEGAAGSDVTTGPVLARVVLDLAAVGAASQYFLTFFASDGDWEIAEATVTSLWFARTLSRPFIADALRINAERKLRPPLDSFDEAMWVAANAFQRVCCSGSAALLDDMVFSLGPSKEAIGRAGDMIVALRKRNPPWLAHYDVLVAATNDQRESEWPKRIPLSSAARAVFASKALSTLQAGVVIELPSKGFIATAFDAFAVASVDSDSIIFHDVTLPAAQQTSGGLARVPATFTLPFHPRSMTSIPDTPYVVAASADAAVAVDATNGITDLPTTEDGLTLTDVCGLSHGLFATGAVVRVFSVVDPSAKGAVIRDASGAPIMAQRMCRGPKPQHLSYAHGNELRVVDLDAPHGPIFSTTVDVPHVENTRITALGCALGSYLLAAGTSEGFIAMYDIRRSGAKPITTVEPAAFDGCGVVEQILFDPYLGFMVSSVAGVLRLHAPQAAFENVKCLGVRSSLTEKEVAAAALHPRRHVVGVLTSDATFEQLGLS